LNSSEGKTTKEIKMFDKAKFWKKAHSWAPAWADMNRSQKSREKEQRRIQKETPTETK
jgi:hypothetical protein